MEGVFERVGSIFQAERADWPGRPESATPGEGTPCEAVTVLSFSSPYSPAALLPVHRNTLRLTRTPTQVRFPTFGSRCLVRAAPFLRCARATETTCAR